MSAFATTSDGSMLGVAIGNSIHLIETASGRRTCSIPVEAPAIGLAFAPGAGFLAVALDNPTVVLHDPRTGKLIRQLSRADAPDFLREKRQQRVVFFGDGKTLVASSDDNSVTVWNCESGQWDGIVRTPHRQGHVAASSNGKFAAIVGAANPQEYCGHVTMYRVNLGFQLVWNGSHEGSGRVSCAAFSPRDTRLATCGAGDGLRVWDVRSGKQLGHQRADEGDQELLSACFVRDEEHLLIASSQRLELRSLNSNKALATARDTAPDELRTCVFSSNGTTAVTLGADATLHVWTVETS